MLNINKQLHNDIKQYCKLNNIDDVEKFCNQMIEKGFTIEKYGDKPNIVSPNKVDTIKVNTEPKIEEVKKIIKINKNDTNDDYEVYDTL
jgi:pentatricopeptide repeat protein